MPGNSLVDRQRVDGTFYSVINSFYAEPHAVHDARDGFRAAYICAAGAPKRIPSFLLFSIRRNGRRRVILHNLLRLTRMLR